MAVVLFLVVVVGIGVLWSLCCSWLWFLVVVVVLFLVVVVVLSLPIFSPNNN